jgi:protein-tyrosine phosphatase
MPSLLEDDPRRYVLEGLEHVLVEIPFTGSANLFLEVGEWIEARGLTPIVAHPERTDAVLGNPALADQLAERRWLLQVNATSLQGRHGAEIEQQAWRLIDDRLAALVASDGHRAARPMRVDGAYQLVRARVGEEQALRLFDGSAVGLAGTAPPRRSLATPPGGRPGSARTSV